MFFCLYFRDSFFITSITSINYNIPIVISPLLLSFYLRWSLVVKSYVNNLALEGGAFKSLPSNLINVSFSLTTVIMPRRTDSQNLAKNQLLDSQNQTQASYPPQRPGKENVADQAEVDLAQVVNRQAQLEGIVEDTNQAIHTIKQLLERIVILPAQPTPRL